MFKMKTKAVLSFNRDENGIHVNRITKKSMLSEAIHDCDRAVTEDAHWCGDGRAIVREGSDYALDDGCWTFTRKSGQTLGHAKLEAREHSPSQ